MNTDTIIEFPAPEESSADYLTQVLRDGAQRLLAQAVEAEAASFLARFSDFTTEDGRQRIVRTVSVQKTPKINLNQVITKGQADMLDVSKAVEAKIKDTVANAVMGIEGKTIDAAKNGAVVAIEETRQKVSEWLRSSLTPPEKPVNRHGSTSVDSGVWLVAKGALGAFVGAVTTMAVQGRVDAKEFGKYPGVYCSSANGEKGTTEDGRQYCAFWFD